MAVRCWRFAAVAVRRKRTDLEETKVIRDFKGLGVLKVLKFWDVKLLTRRRRYEATFR